MTANAFSYRVYAATGLGGRTRIPASVLKEATGPGTVFVDIDTPEPGHPQMDLSTVSIQAPQARADSDVDVSFSYNTCLRSGGYHGWDSAAVMRRDTTGWRVVSVDLVAHDRGTCG
ncbi:hypothetical protein ACFOLC_09960 [Lysobacter cavernae]|uniref:Uncharacterized protein n=1 Tax=Lysobacter cavernae TaxID=1685901 RepID=A0ABV7RRB0_9GAMM